MVQNMWPKMLTLIFDLDFGKHSLIKINKRVKIIILNLLSKKKK